MPAEAVVAVKRLQPYNATGDEKRAVLRLIAVLQNADKHRSLIVFPRGVDEVVTTISIGDKRRRVRHEKGLFEDGAPLLGVHIPPGTAESEMNVQIRGIATIAIEVGGVDGYFEMPNVLDWMVTQVEATCSLLEPFVRASHGRDPT